MLYNNKVSSSIIVGMLAGASQAMTMGQNSPLSLAQVSVADDCCCQALPCMPTCMDTCAPEPLPPVFVEPLPPQVGESLLNLDVLVTHIVHGLRNDDEEIPVPAEPEEEHEFIQNVITPIVIEVMAKDIAPALPVCTYPDGRSFYLDSKMGETNVESTLPDQNALLQGVLDDLINGDSIDVHTKSVLENLNVDQIIEDLTIQDASGQNAIEVIVAAEKTETTIDGETGEVKESTTVAGAAERKADDIKATVDEMTDDANESVDVSDVLLD